MKKSKKAIVKILRYAERVIRSRDLQSLDVMRCMSPSQGAEYIYRVIKERDAKVSSNS